MNAFLLVVGHQLRTRVVGMQLYLVDSRDRLAGGVTEKLFEVFDAEVRHADVADFAASREFLQFLPGISLALYGRGVKRKHLPCLDEVPVR